MSVIRTCDSGFGPLIIWPVPIGKVRKRRPRYFQTQKLVSLSFLTAMNFERAMMSHMQSSQSPPQRGESDSEIITFVLLIDTLMAYCVKANTDTDTICNLPHRPYSMPKRLKKCLKKIQVCTIIYLTYQVSYCKTVRFRTQKDSIPISKDMNRIQEK